MANIALDIKANTTKALGEFKKLSRELDNKFLVQGLKLDVVKNAFRQINREFEQSLGSQGIAASESTGQIQRNAAAQLALYSRLGVDASLALTRETKKQLQELVAQGDLTKSVMQEALSIQGSIKFDGADFEERSKALTTQIAKLGQDFNDILGNNKGLETLNQLVTGNLKIDDLENLDLGAGGAASNLIKETIRSISGGRFDSMSVVERSKVLEEAMAALNDSGNRFGKLMDEFRRDAESTTAFQKAIREFTGIFSEGGVLGPLKSLGKMEAFGFKPGDDLVDRNILQLSAKLINTLFDQKEGLFAVLFATLGEAFGFSPGSIIEPILRGTELLISVFENITEFIRSPAFRNFLGIFQPLVDAIKGVEMPKSFSKDEVNNSINKIFGGIRGLLNNLNTYIANVDTKVISDIVGNFLGQIIETLPDLITVVFTSIGKAIDFIIELLNSDGVKGADIGSILSSVINGVGDLIGKLFNLIGAALPKVVGGALDGAGGLDGKGTLVVGAAIAEGLTRLFTGKGILGNLKDKVIGGARTGASKINPFSKDRNIRRDTLAAKGTDQQRWGRLYQYLDRILQVLGGDTTGLGDGPDRDGRDRRRRRSRQEQSRRDRRARELRRSRQNRDILNGTRRRSRFARGASRLRRFGGFGIDALRRGTQAITPGRFRGYTNPIGPLPLNSRAPYAPAPGGGFTPRLESALRPSRFSQASTGVRNFGSGVSQGVNQRLRGGFGLDAGNRLNRTLIGTRSPDVAARFARQYGTRGILSRAGGRLGGGLLKGALAVGTLAALFSGGAAMAKDIDKDDTLSPEEKEYYKAENQKRTREEAGKAVVGAAGGVIGAAIGSVIPGGGTVIGGIIGGIAGEILANVLPAPILEGVGKLAEDIGGWFTGAWQNIKGGWIAATTSIGNFFGKEGPIQRFGRFAGDNVKGGVENIQKFFGEEGPIASVGNFFKDLPGKVAETIEKASERIFEGISGAVTGFATFILRNVGLNELADKIEGKEDKETNNFAGGFRYLGGRNAFNEYEGFQMPDGVTFVPLSSLDTSVSSSGGTTTNNLEITVNVTGDDPKAIANEVIAEIDKIYQSINV